MVAKAESVEMPVRANQSRVILTDLVWKDGFYFEGSLARIEPWSKGGRLKINAKQRRFFE